MNKWESAFINGLGGGLLGVTIMDWKEWPYTLPLFILVVAWGIYLEKINNSEEVE